MYRRRGEPAGGGLLGPAPESGRSGQAQQLRKAAPEQIGTRFTMKQHLVSFGDDFWIANERGEKVFKVDGKLLRLRDTLVLEDAHGRELVSIKARLVDVRETMEIARPNGATAAVVHDAWLSPVRDRWTIDVPGAPGLVAQGNILQHEYEIRQSEHGRVAEISKRWLRLRDTYQVQAESGQDAALLLAITIVIDMMSHNHAADTTAGGISKGGLDVL